LVPAGGAQAGVVTPAGQVGGGRRVDVLNAVLSAAAAAAGDVLLDAALMCRMLQL
jgi:hypothetical protein